MKQPSRAVISAGSDGGPQAEANDGAIGKRGF
jgi:hypothetical protein